MNNYDWFFVVIGSLAFISGINRGQKAAESGNWTGMIWYGFFMILGAMVVADHWK